MKTFNWPYDLENDRFSGDLALCSANSTPPKSVQAIILCAILNFSEDCQAIIPTFTYRDLNGKETIIKEWHYETIDVGNNFYNAPKTVNISWYPYGTFEVKKVKKLLEEEIEKHILFKNNIIKKWQYGWKLSWKCDFAEHIISDAKQFAKKVSSNLNEKLQNETKTPTTDILITEKQIKFNSGGSYSRYIDFEREGLVDLKNYIQILGCAYAILEFYGNAGEWEIKPYLGEYNQCCCTLIRHSEKIRKQW